MGVSKLWSQQQAEVPQANQCLPLPACKGKGEGYSELMLALCKACKQFKDWVTNAIAAKGPFEVGTFAYRKLG